MNAAIQRYGDQVSDVFELPAAGQQGATGRPSSCLTADVLARLPVVCGICRTLDPGIVPEHDEDCAQCREAGEHIDWSDIDAIEEAILAATQ